MSLVRESGTVGEVASTARFSPALASGEAETRILAQSGTTTEEAIGGQTAKMAGLEGRRTSVDTGELSIRKSRRRVVIAAAILIAAVLGVAYFYASRGGSGSTKNSIAVLPFRNAGGDPNIEYLSDGISESLINSLSQLPNVRVLARSTMFRFKGQDADPQQVGRQLGVDTVLMGRVIQVGDNLDVQAELVNVADGSQVWGERYSRKVADVLAVQEDIAREIVGRLRPKLGGEQQERVTKRYTDDAEAYQLYLQGRYQWNKRSPEGIRRAASYFTQAIAKDPNYALAYAGLADAYSLMPIYDSAAKPKEVMPRAREAALKALALDDNLAEAHASLAVILDIYDWNSPEAIKHYRRALELNPNFATGYRWLGERYVADGRIDEGLTEIRRSIELDPFSLPSNGSLGGALNYARRYDEAIIQLQKTLELDPNFRTANYGLYEAYANKGMYAEAVAAYLKLIALDGDPSRVEGAKEAFAKNGWQGFLRHEAAYLEKQSQQFPQETAQLYARLGDKDKAFGWLERAYEERSESMTWLKVDPAYDPLRSDPRFTDLLRRVGLSQNGA